MESEAQAGTTGVPPPGRDGWQVDVRSVPGVPVPGVLLALALLSGFYVVARILSPGYAAGVQTAFTLSLNAGVMLALSVLPTDRQLPGFLLLVTAFSFVVRLGAYPAVYAAMATAANVTALLLFRVLAVRYADGGRRPDHARCLVPMLLSGFAAALLSAVTATGLMFLARDAGWLSAARTPSLGFLFGTRLAAQSSGIITFAPLLLMLLRCRPGTWPWATWAEIGGWLAVMVAVGVVVVQVPAAAGVMPVLLLVTFAGLLLAVLRRGSLAAAVLTPAFAVCSAAMVLPSTSRPAVLPAPLEVLPSQVAGLVGALLAWAVALTVAERDVARARVASERAAQEALTTLQRALLPSGVTAAGDVRIASRYRAAGSLHRIGGDWYDTTTLPSGGTAMVIGDVEGHDLQAASVMGLVRGAVRSYALEGHSPAGVLDRVSTFLISAGCDRLVTMVYVEIYAGGTMATFAVAGHPSPLIVPPDGPAGSVRVRSGPILGVDGVGQWEEQTVRLPCDGVLVLYTDGLVDFPSASVDQAGQLLDLATTVGSGDLERLADTLIASASAYDDAAVLVARLPSRSAPVLERSFPAQPSSAGVARVWLGDVLDILRADGLLPEAGAETLGVAQLLLTELVSNAVRYSERPVLVRLHPDGGRLCVDVEDTSERMPVLRHPEDAAAEGRGLRLVDGLADDWGVRLVDRGKIVWFALACIGGEGRHVEAGRTVAFGGAER